MDLKLLMKKIKNENETSITYMKIKRKFSH